MAILAALSFLFGAMLGRYKVLVLVPTIVIGGAAMIGVGIARADDVWAIGLTVALISVCLQIGYLCGATIFSLVVAAGQRGLDTGYSRSHKRYYASSR